MSKAGNALTDIRALEELAQQDTFVHRRHPLASLLVTLGFIVASASYGKYALSPMLPLLFYPLFIFSYGNIPPGTILKRLLPALPLVIGIGVFNPIFDKAIALVIGGVAISAGWVSFLSILLRCCLSVIAALLLVATSGMGGISSALRLLGVPRILVAQLLMTFRYIHVLGSEAGRMLLAYRLRAPGQKGIAYRQWGSFSGQWLLRSLGRADRLHSAMLCRGYTGEMPSAKARPFTLPDLGYVLAWLMFFAAVRLIDIPQEIGRLIMAIGG